MPDIGTLAVKLAASDGGFNAVIDSGIRKAQEFRTSIAGIGAGATFAGLGAAAGNIGTILQGHIGAGVNGLLGQFKGTPAIVSATVDALSQVPGPVGAIARVVGQVAIPAINFLKDTTIGAAQEFVSAAERGMARIREQVRLTKQFGMSLASAAGLQLLAAQTGQDVGDMVTGMMRLNRAMGQARGGALASRRTFEEFGVSLESIASGDTTRVLADMRRHWQESGADVQEMSLALSHLVGPRNMGALIPLLTEQGDGFEEATRRAIRFGLAVSDAEGRAVKGANRARQRMAADWGALWAGLENRAAVALAPAWEGIAKGLDNLVNRGQPALSGVFTTIDTIGKGVTWVIDGVNAGLEKWGPHIDASMRAFEDIGQIISLIFTSTSGAENTWRSIGEVIATGIAHDLRRAAVFGLDLAESGLQIWRTFRGAVMQVDNLINGIRRAYSTARDSAQNLARLDPTGNATRLFNSLNLPTALGSQSNLAGNLADVADVLDRIREARDRLNDGRARNSLFVALERTAQQALTQEAMRARRNPLEGVTASALNETLDGLRQQQAQLLMTAEAYHAYQLQQRGFNAAQIEAASAIFRTNEILRMASAAPSVQTPGALSQGSAAALNAVNQARMQEERDTPEERIRQAIEQQRVGNERRERYLQEMAASLRRLGYEMTDLDGSD
jgi:hypothetical protein